jgi:hypothetical protein
MSRVPSVTMMPPLKEFEPLRISVPLPAFVRPPGPVRFPDRAMLPPVVSTVAFPPLPVRVILSDDDQGAAAPSVPPPRFIAAVPEPLVRPATSSRPPLRL